MDKKSTIVIAVLFVLIVIGSVVYTVFSVVKSDGLEVDRRANVIKEEMVSMEQSLDDGSLNKDEDKKDKTDVKDSETIDNSQTANNTHNNQNLNQNKNQNQNLSTGNTQNQNKPIDNHNNQTNTNQTPVVDNSNNNSNTNAPVDNSGSANVSAPVEETPVEPPRVIRPSEFYIKIDSQGHYKEGMQLRQEGTDIYIYGDIEGSIDKVYVPLLVKSPESYSNVQFYGLVGSVGKINEWYKGEGGVPTTAFAIRHVAGSTINVQIGWQESEVITYTIHFNLEQKK